MKNKMLLPIFLLFFVAFGMAGNKYFLDYDGNDDYVRYADDSSLEILNGSSNYTLEGWVYVADDAADLCDIYRRSDQFVIYYRKTYQSLGVGIYSSGWKYYHSTDNTLTPNTWHHFAIIRNNTLAHYFHIYIDGIDVIDGTYNAYVLTSSNTYNLYIGNDGNGGHYFKGYIDEIRLKNIAENPDTLHYHKNDAEYNSDNHTAVLFHFDEGSGQYTINESSGNNARLGSTTAGDAAEPTWRVWNYDGSDLSLPVELTSFTAAYANRAVHLHWQTASEVENLGFVILRSLTGTGPFNEIASYQTDPALRGAGNSSQEHHYSYTDVNVIPKQTYWYKLVNVDLNGTRTEHPPISVKTTGSGSDLISEVGGGVPKAFALYQNYPNPFNPETKIKFDVPVTDNGSSKVILSVYDLNGKKVRTLFANNLNAGHYSLKWDGTNAHGQKLNSGMYLLNLKAGNYSQTVKMIILR